jgi:hypothetical protein
MDHEKQTEPAPTSDPAVGFSAGLDGLTRLHEAASKLIRHGGSATRRNELAAALKAINPQDLANSENFATWWNRNRKRTRLKVICTTDGILIEQLLRAAYDRKDLVV